MPVKKQALLPITSVTDEEETSEQGLSREQKKKVKYMVTKYSNQIMDHVKVEKKYSSKSETETLTKIEENIKNKVVSIGMTLANT